jgi:hypothetical protein
MAVKPDYLDLDFIYANNYSDFTSPIPYRNGVEPLSNGNCPRFDRSNSVLFPQSFADCVEIMIRHFANIVFYRGNCKIQKTKDY